jgi:FliI/YscN family ATPase
MAELFAHQAELFDRTSTLRVTGRVVEVTGLTILADGLRLPVGAMCEIARNHEAPVAAQIVGVRGSRAVLMPLRDPTGVSEGDAVGSAASLQHVPVGRQMLGGVLDGMGQPIGGRTDYAVEAHYPVFREAPRALDRAPVASPLATGVRSIDAFTTIGVGQRMGIFAGTGVGKSVLMGMISRYTSADVTVVALVGERGREVGDFLRKDLGEEGLAKAVMVVSTSDESPVLRVRAGFVATAVAEYFRDLGNDVLLMMDSTTRMAMAQRQIGLSAGEPPATKGYPPSVFSLLPTLMERSGRCGAGSITGIYTVLVEGDDLTEPVADAMRGILDGHIWLSRDLANRTHFPAISVLESTSRVMPDVVEPRELRAARAVRRVLANWADMEDLVNIGAYAKGSNAEFDVALEMKPRIDAFLQQDMHESSTLDDTRARLVELAGEIEAVSAEIKKRRDSKATASAA